MNVICRISRHLWNVSSFHSILMKIYFPSLQMDFCACNIMSISCHMILYNISSAIQQVNIKLNCLVCVCHCWFLFSLDIITLCMSSCLFGVVILSLMNPSFTDNKNNWELMPKILIYYSHFLLLCSRTWLFGD